MAVNVSARPTQVGDSVTFAGPAFTIFWDPTPMDVRTVPVSLRAQSMEMCRVIPKQAPVTANRTLEVRQQ